MDLAEGDYLIEVSFARPCSPDVLQDGLRALGFSEATLDQSLVMSREPEKASEWTDGVNVPNRYRFVGRLESKVTLTDSDDVRWGFAHKLRHDPFTDISSQMKHMYILLPEERYELRFIQRRVFQDKNVFRGRATEALTKMGFEVEKLLCLHRDMRVPDIASVCLWIAIGTWKKGKSIIHIEDPLFFQDVVVLGNDATSIVEMPHAQGE